MRSSLPRLERGSASIKTRSCGHLAGWRESRRNRCSDARFGRGIAGSVTTATPTTSCRTSWGTENAST
eukprot:978220-Rhodomonas_salina.1